MKNVYKENCKELPICNISDKAITGMLTAARSSHLAPGMLKPVPRAAPHRFWVKYHQLLNFWLNQSSIAKIMKITKTTFKMFKRYGENELMCKKICVWNMGILEVKLILFVF